MHIPSSFWVCGYLCICGGSFKVNYERRYFRNGSRYSAEICEQPYFGLMFAHAKFQLDIFNRSGEIAIFLKMK